MRFYCEIDGLSISLERPPGQNTGFKISDNGSEIYISNKLLMQLNRMIQTMEDMIQREEWEERAKKEKLLNEISLREVPRSE